MMNIGLVGCGAISGIYFQNLSTLFPNTRIVACCDLNEEKAKAAAQQWNIPKVATFEEMLADPDIDTILNLTIPRAHYSLCKQALLAGKNAYVEKPLALTYAEGKELVELAEEKGLYLGCAPDTFLGAGIQTCKALIDGGAIGRPVSGAAYMMWWGNEYYRPDADFYYDVGGGPLYDMGPYYLTAMVHLLGRAESVFAFGNKAFEQRTCTCEPRNGAKIDVKVDTTVMGLIRFENGATVSLTTSFDIFGAHSMPKFELYGSEGTMSLPDPNGFGGPVKAAQLFGAFEEKELISPYFENSRGIGLAEIELARSEGRINHASGRLALHVLEIMEALTVSAKEGRVVKLESSPVHAPALDWQVEKGQLKTK